MIRDKSDKAWPYYRFWFSAVVVAEVLMLWRHQDLVLIYSVVAVAFLGGWILRFFRLYPGQPEPLILDLSGAILAAGYAVGAACLKDSSWRFLLILCSSPIIFPHVIYVYLEKS